MEIKIKEKQKNLRLDKFLAQNFPQFSRKWLQKLIKEGNILINNKKVRPRYLLKKDDKIKINLKKPPKISLKPDPNIKINIVYENNDLLVINKPAGIVVHPSQTTKSKTLINGLLAIRPEIKNVGDKENLNFRPGILHRLDKQTSGLLIIAKNNKTFSFLKNQFKNREIVKKYYALVVNGIKKDKFLIDFPITRSKKIPSEQKAILSKNNPLFPKAKKAQTKIKVLEKIGNYNLVEAQPITGRMHQIRIHLSSIGHPIVGDDKYGKKYKEKFLGLKRNFLHAYYLKFKSPKNNILELKLELPKELKGFLRKLKTNSGRSIKDSQNPKLLKKQKY